MTESPWPGAADVLARVGHHWGWLMAFGAMETPWPCGPCRSDAWTTAHAL